MEKKIIAANGINIYHYKQLNNHSICISLYIKTGTLYENDNNGITHFLEHLHFRRLGNRNQKGLYYELESIGGYFGACTYKEFMRFYLTSSPKYFGELSTIAADILGSLQADSKDFSAEKRLVLSEIREDNQNNDIDFFSNKYIWEDTNLQNPVLGSIASIKKLDLQTLHGEKERTFTKRNLFFYVTGCFEDEDILILKRDVEKYDLSARPNTNNDNMAKIPRGFQNRDAFVKLSNRTYSMHDVKISFDVDFSRVSRRELLYLDSLLADGLCSLLRAELIEKKGLIYSISSTIEQYNNIGVYYFKFSIYKSKLLEIVRSFISVLMNVKQELSDEDIQCTRVFKTDNQMMMLDDLRA